MHWKNSNWWVSNFNFKEEVKERYNISDNLKIHDATLRDGEQTPGVVLKREEKVEIARRLDEIGVHRIEAGMPAVSDDDRKAITDIKKLDLNADIFAFVRAKKEDIMMCKESGVDGVIIEIPIGKPKLKLQFNWDVERIIDTSIEAINMAKELGLYTVYFPYDTTRADEEDLEKLLTAVMNNSSPDSLGVVDTMGCALPGTMGYMTKLLKEMTGLPIEVHTHNDFGLALANSIEAAASGAEVIHCCINGMGERTGNASLEEVVMVLKLLIGHELDIDVKKLVELSGYVEEITGFKLARNKPVVGKANFTRESGIGADALLNTPLAMFAINPAYLGRRPELVLGKKSGLTSIKMKLAEYDIQLDEEKMKSLLKDVKEFGIKKKDILTEEEFLNLVAKYQ